MSSLLEFIQAHEEAFRSRSRLASLYSDFRSQRSSNPDGYAANSQAWLRALTAAAEAGKLPGQHDGSGFIVSTGEELARALQTPQFGRPLALQTVIDDAISQSRLIPVADFLAAKSSIYGRGWDLSPQKIISWAWSRVGMPQRSVGSDLVVMRSLERTASLIESETANASSSNVSRIFSRELFLNNFEPILGRSSVPPLDFKILTTYLARDRQLLSYDENSDTVKIRGHNEHTAPSITREDIDIASLRNLIFSLEKQSTRLEQEVGQYDRKVRDAVAAKNLSGARNSLRSKKLAETTLQSRQTTLHQLQDVYLKIEQAADQVEVVRVMQSAGRTLKTLNQQAGDVDDIRDVMDDLKERMADTDEISEAISSGNMAAVDDAELEDELEELERHEREKVAQRDRQQESQQAEAEAEKTRRRLAALDIVSDVDAKATTSPGKDLTETNTAREASEKQQVV